MTDIHILTKKLFVYLAFFMVGILQSSCSNGCGGNSNDSTSKQISVGVSGEPENLNPIFSQNSVAKQITSLVFDGLTNPTRLGGDMRQEYVFTLARNI